MNTNRRTWLTTVLATGLLSAVGHAQTAPVTLEIIAFAHPPVQAALKPLRDWLPTQGNRIKVVEIDMESSEAQQRLKSLGLTGHLPIVLVINGQYRHKRANGSTVEFVSFPAIPKAAGGEANKGWTVDDVKATLTATFGK